MYSQTSGHNASHITVCAALNIGLQRRMIVDSSSAAAAKTCCNRFGGGERHNVYLQKLLFVVVCHCNKLERDAQ
jgi:hypothetical protein